MNTITSVSELLNELEEATRNNDPVSLKVVIKTIGRRSFGPIILAIGLFLAVPGASDIPSVPTLLGTLVFLIGIQIVFNNKHIWLPSWLLERSLSRETVQKTIERLHTPAKYLDRVIYHRLHTLTTESVYRAIAGISIVVALLTPLMELVPLSANIAGVIYVFFGLGLVGRDGLMNLFGLLFCLILGIVLVYFLV